MEDLRAEDAEKPSSWCDWQGLLDDSKGQIQLTFDSCR